MSDISSRARRKDVILSPREIEGLIADGRYIFILENKVIKADAWINYHPGGLKAIQHMVGRDATDEVTALHSAETRKQITRYQIGTIEKSWKNFVPPIQGGVFRKLCMEGEEESESESDGSGRSSSESTRAASLVFDGDQFSVRRRRGLEESDATSVTSMSSVSSSAIPDDLAFLDSQTKQEIDLDLSKYPALDPEVQEYIIQKYRLLSQRIQAEGLYECNYTAYAWEAARWSFLFASMLFFLHIGWYCTSGAFLGMFWSQLVFAAHDAGHVAITHNFTIDTLIGMIIAAPIGGLSLGWWKRTHNVHHIVTNSPEHDPDNQHLPIFAVNHRFLGNIWSTYHERLLPYDSVAKFLVPFQAYMYYPVLALGRFNLYVQSWKFLLLGQGPRKGIAWWHRYFELAGNAVFWYWFGYLLVYKSIPTPWSRFGFVMVAHMINMPLHVQLTISHFAMSTTDLGPNESFPMKMLRTTMDVDCPAWLDFFHGGLQFQAVHHLFPRVPRHNLRRAQKLVMEFCEEVKIPYALYGFVDGNREVIGKLSEVSRQATILAKCQRTVAERGDIFHGH
ncbi:fatty acid/sphingolipid desaturase [Hyaloscypha variabilis F]|uniref:Delta 8-(E)-sphingolipid desaturase n=1 Tax=Hyaloscypha variabilis (strain UAMH 11265 / GT02V1 / F) TaxID=1149755 RepID=A0A2J6R0Y4_HYAVF|nr:fatty acid/sphingolipid desaturase [Hyaloscypha variabilis F]